MRIYLSGGWEERLTVVQPMVRAVQALGHTCTLDWTTGENMKDAMGGDSTMLAAMRREIAEAEYAAVRSADVVWLLAPGYRGSAGSWFEFGCAVGIARTLWTGKLVLASGPSCARSIFTELDGVQRFEHHTDALDYIEKGLPVPLVAYVTLPKDSDLPRQGESLGDFRARTGRPGSDTHAARTLRWCDGQWTTIVSPP